MTKQTLEVPAKPTEMVAFWPSDGRKEVKKKDGLWLQYRDILIGPFPNRTEASWYDGQLQEVIMGWIDKSRFAGRIFPFGDVWYVERWATNDGPFTSMAVAWDHRQALYIDYRQFIGRHWDNSGGHPADIERQKAWSKVPAEAMDDINFNTAKILAEPRMTIPESLRPKAEFQADIPAEATNDPTLNYKGYAVSQSTGVVHVDPSTGLLHRDDHICNQQCRDLAARAQAEYEVVLRRESGSKVEKPKKTTDDIMDVSFDLAKFQAEYKMLTPESLSVKEEKAKAELRQKSGSAVENAANSSDDIPIPASDEQARLITAMADELMKRSVNITPGSCVYLAGYLAARAVKEGWGLRLEEERS